MKLGAILAATAVGVASVANATDYLWTGASDAYWTNAANWKVDGAVAANPPGLYISYNPAGGYFTNGTDRVNTDVAIFGAEATTRTTINLDGQWSVKNVVVTNVAPAVTPAFVFGADANNQRQYFKVTGNNAKFIVREGVTTTQTIQRVCGIKDPATGSDAHRLEIYANSPDAVVVFGGLRRIGTWDGKVVNGCNIGLNLYGPGEIRMTGDLNYDQSNGIYMWQTGLFYMGNSSAGAGNRFAKIQSQDNLVVSPDIKREIEIPTNCYLNAGYGGDDGLYAYGNTHLFGEGAIAAKESYWNGGDKTKTRGCRIVVGDNRELTVDCGIKATGGANGQYLGSVACDGSGVLNIRGWNNCVGSPRFFGANSKMKVNKIGLSGTYDGYATNSCLGAGKELQYFNTSSLIYVGDREEVTDRNFVATNSAGGITMNFVNRGTAKVTFNSDSHAQQRYTTKSAKLKFSAFEAPIVYEGDFDNCNWEVQVDGTAGVAFGSNIGSVPVRILEGATLSIDDQHGIPAGYAFAGNGNIKVADGVDIELSDLPAFQAGKKLNFVLDATQSSVSINGAEAGLLKGVTVNGVQAKLNDVGKIVAAEIATWTKIGNGNWSATANWESEKKPTVGDVAHVATHNEAKETFTITLDEPATLSMLTHQETFGGRQSLGAAQDAKTLTLGAGGYIVRTNTTEAIGSNNYSGGPLDMYSPVHLAASQRWLLGAVRGWNCSNRNNIRNFQGNLSSDEGVEWSLYGYNGYRFEKGNSDNFKGTTVVGAPVQLYGTDQFDRLGTKGITLRCRRLTDKEAYDAGTTNMAPMLTFGFKSAQEQASGATIATPITLDSNVYVNNNRLGWSYSYIPVCMAFPDSTIAIDDPLTLTFTGGFNGSTANAELLFSQAWGIDSPVCTSYNLFPNDQKIVVAGDGKNLTGGYVHTVTMIEIAHANALGSGNNRTIRVGTDGYWSMNQVNSIQGVVVRPGLTYSGNVDGIYRNDNNAINYRQAFMQVGSAATAATPGATTATFTGNISSGSWACHKLRLTSAKNTTAKFTGKVASVVNGTTSMSAERGAVYGYHVDIIGEGDVELSNTSNSFDTNLCVRAGRLVLDANGVTGAKPVMLGGFVPTLTSTKTVRCVCTDYTNFADSNNYTFESVDGKQGNKITWKNVPSAMDGVQPEVGDYVLITIPRSHAFNGIWEVISDKVWKRPADIDEPADIEQKSGLRVKVKEGTRFGGKAFMLVTNQTYFRQAERQYASAQEQFVNGYGAPQFHLESVAEPDVAILAGTEGLALSTVIEVTDNASTGASAIGSRDGVSAASFSGKITLEKSVTLAAAANSTVTFTSAFEGNGDIIGGGKGKSDITGANLASLDSANGFVLSSGTLKVGAAQLNNRPIAWRRSADATSATEDATGCLEVVGDLDLSNKTIDFEGLKISKKAGDDRGNRTWTIAKATGSLTPPTQALPAGWSLKVVGTLDGNLLQATYTQPGMILMLK